MFVRDDDSERGRPFRRANDFKSIKQSDKYLSRYPGVDIRPAKR